MTETLKPRTEQVPTTETEINPFYAHGEAAERITGCLVKCIDGEWLSGADGKVLPHGTKVLVNMSSMQYGYQRWDDGRVTERLMGRIADNFKPPHRKELGDLNEDDWPVGPDGQRRDPWQQAQEVEVILDASGPERNAIFVTNSQGGFGALASMCKPYAQHQRQHPDEYPIAELGSGSYYSKKWNRKVRHPVLTIVGWSTIDDWMHGDVGIDEGDAPKDPKPDSSEQVEDFENLEE